MEDREIVELYWQRSDLAISETEQKCWIKRSISVFPGR